MPMPSGLPDAAMTASPDGASATRGPVFYLHGFAPSAKSTKAHYFADRLRGHGVTLRCPDFNEPDFATLPLTRMLGELQRQLEEAGDRPAAVIGSSLGGTLAILAAEKLALRID